MEIWKKIIAKRSKLFLFLFLAAFSLNAQSFHGLHSSSYFPLQKISNQPADILESRYKWQVNVLSPQLDIYKNRALDDSWMGQLSNSLGITNFKSIFSSSRADYFLRSQIIFPSVVYKPSDKHAFALTTKLNGLGKFESTSSAFFDLLVGELPNEFKNINGDFFKSVVNTWWEFKLSYAHKLYEDDAHKWTGGLSASALSSLGSAYVELEDISAEFDQEMIDHLGINVRYGLSDNVSKSIYEDKTNLMSGLGFSIDLGVNYIKKSSQSRIPHEYKIGFSVTDIGHINNKQATETALYSINAENISTKTFSNISDITELIDTLNNLVNTNKVSGNSFKTNLPTNFMLTSDFHLNNFWFLNAMVRQTLNPFRGLGREIINLSEFMMSITPRFENEVFGAFLPIGYSNKRNFTVGTACKYRFIFVGSGNIWTSLINQDNTEIELYIGINIPINPY